MPEALAWGKSSWGISDHSYSVPTQRISEINSNLTPPNPKFLHSSTDTTLLYLNIMKYL
jgi:hypothetical protein